MKKSLILLATILCTWSLSAQEPLWLRKPAISPDGSTIAFTYKGDIYTVPAQGGKATQVTSNPAYESLPIWSPDSKTIAFISNREGASNLYTIQKDGSKLHRLTSVAITPSPLCYLNDTSILVSMYMMPGRTTSQAPIGVFKQVYTVHATTGQYQQLTSITMDDISISPDGQRWLYTDLKGFEDTYRKHQTSSIARDVWQFEPQNGKFTKLTQFKGEDRNAVWAPDGKSYYYLSEETGSFNIHKALNGQVNPITQLKKHPIRDLSIAKNGLMAFSYDGQLFTIKDGEAPKKVNVQIVADPNDRDVILQTLRANPSDFAVSPDGKEVALIVRGDVFVTSTDYSSTRRITNTAEQERDLSFSPDGRKILYSSERDGHWNVYEAKIANANDKQFVYASQIDEKRLTNTTTSAFQASYSPDGKKIAYLEDRTAIKVLDIESGNTITALDKNYNYSYVDGDQSYQWSPDSRWFLCTYMGNQGWNNVDVALVKADGSEKPVNLTNSGYSDGNAKWVLDGKAMIWTSDRAGFRSHGSWGAEGDWYIMFFDAKAWDKFQMDEEDLMLLEEKEKANKVENADDKKGKKDKKTDKKEDSPVVPELKFDLDNTIYRMARLTPNSSFVGDAILSAKGDKIFYFTSFEGKGELWSRHLKTKETKLISKGTGYAAFASPKDAKSIFIASNGQIQKLDTASGRTTPISFQAEFEYKPAQEREYIFNHAWQQVKDKFYDPSLHGVDWEAYKVDYLRYLPHINNTIDYAEMLSELLGELNASHTGARAGIPQTYSTACLGAYYDPHYNGPGVKILEILKNAPLDKTIEGVKEGQVILKIDGREITGNFDEMLNNKVGKEVRLTLLDPQTNKTFDAKVNAISFGMQNELLYRRWVESRRKLVDSLSGGRLAYVHVRAMNSPSFRQTYLELLGEKNRTKEGVVVDTRHNGGGWLHDDLATLLSGKTYQYFEPRGQHIGNDPFNKWCKPSVVVMSESNYSNGHGFPLVYKTLGIGQLVGAPVPGTMTAVWWESQIDPSIVFGIPQVTCKDMQGRVLENFQLEPDIEVYNTPESILQGRDLQIEAAVKSLLK